MPSSARLTAIPYHPDSAHWFDAIRHLPSPIWLDSGRPKSSYGRYDIMCADPETVITTTKGVTRVADKNGSVRESLDNPFSILRACLPEPCGASDLPFCGGAAGYFGYDLGRHLERLPNLAAQDIELPDLRVGIYPWAIVQDHEQCKAWLVSLPTATDLAEIQSIVRFHDLKQNIKRGLNTFKINKFRANLNAIKHANAVAKIQAYIDAGDCYQVNFAQRFSSDYAGDPFMAYLALREVMPSPFSAFMEFDQQAILSLSPERFIRVADGVAETQPIKGTIARGATPEADNENARRLQASLKDRAENLMIVDLLRNDLSKSCVDVAVPELFSLQSFANVHHLVSTITARLKPRVSASQVLEDCFPGGSITGAPKIRAMEIIEELEPTRRSVYCGSLGYISADGKMDTNIAIRSLVCDGGNLYCWGGGGIVADSQADMEYEESVTKVKVLMDTLEREFLNAED